MKKTLSVLAACILASGLASAALTDGLIAYWDYDSGTKTNPVTYVQNAPGWSGYYESGYTYKDLGGVANSGYAELSGAGSYYTDNCGLSTATGFSASFVIKEWGSSTNVINFQDDGGHLILKIRSNQFSIETTGTAMGTGPNGAHKEHNVSLTSSEWNRLTMVCATDGSITLYANGVAYETDLTLSGTLKGAQIASAYGMGSWNTTAHLDDIAIWNRELTAAEATALSANAAVPNTVVPSQAIPEPATATLSLLALAGLAARRRRK